MKSTRQAGAMNLLAIPLVLLIIVLIGVSVFAFTAAGQAADYKNNVDQKVAVAVEEAEKTISAQKDKDFAEKEKFPYDVFVAPESAGSLRLQYPKTWSGYVVVPQGRTSKPVDGFFHPGQVPNVSEGDNSFALRVTVEEKAYDTVVKSYNGDLKNGKVTIRPYQSPNVANLVGVRVDGEVKNKKQGSMVILPFRDKTLTMWTESVDFRADFDNIILKNFTLVP